MADNYDYAANRRITRRRVKRVMSEAKNNASELKRLLGVLNTEIRHIFDNDISFLKRFGKGEIMDLTEVSFTSHHLKIVYVLDCGQHVCDTVAMDDYMEWRDDVPDELVEGV